MGSSMQITTNVQNSYYMGTTRKNFDLLSGMQIASLCAKFFFNGQHKERFWPTVFPFETLEQTAKVSKRPKWKLFQIKLNYQIVAIIEIRAEICISYLYFITDSMLIQFVMLMYDDHGCSLRWWCGYFMHLCTLFCD